MNAELEIRHGRLDAYNTDCASDTNASLTWDSTATSGRDRVPAHMTAQCVQRRGDVRVVGLVAVESQVRGALCYWSNYILY